ncbi:MAG: class I SAM-dependent methyltransferase [Candidatus Handelsmanbacteria bacterium]|nr:class I SAM-dependent methyltransferase [Candidatus Handelsmanbacteria bacterium]
MSSESIEMAKNRAYKLIKEANDDLEAGRIDEAGWYQRGMAVITPAYLAGDNPRSQSGHSGDEKHWRHARSLVAEAMDRDGDFLDVGCASGHLMECVQLWAGERGVQIEPYGLDIAPELAALARRRLPQWAERIWVGNAIDWVLPRHFDYVRTGLEYVPPRRQPELVRRLLDLAVAPGGRLFLGTQSEEIARTRTQPSHEEVIASWGFRIAGSLHRPHYQDERLEYQLCWIEAGR